MQDAAKLVFLRNSFYRDNFKSITFILLFSICLNIIMVIAIFQAVKNPPQAIFFATKNNGKIITIPPVQKAYFKNKQIVAWVSNSVSKIFALDFLNYRQSLNSSKELFTNYGWGQFVKAFQPELNKIINNKMVSHAVPSNVPTITKQGVTNNLYSWQVRIPMTLYFQKGNVEKQQRITWQVLIQRRNNPDSQELIGISQIIQTNNN
ncbi:MAG: hypothetical protein COB50_02995 [Thiotrichales bacterium]|nr:MAG: hypothetical protein COB50_02995 [Thiotrichales bacterium]